MLVMATQERTETWRNIRSAVSVDGAEVASINLYVYAHARSMACADNLIVNAPYRRRGIGRALIEQMKLSAAAAGITVVEGYPVFDQPWLLDLYRSTGAVVVGSRVVWRL